MKRLLEDIRPIALVGIATVTFVSLRFFLFLLLDQFASHFGLSDKVDELFRLIEGILVFQLIFMLLLIWGLERAMAKPPKTEVTETTKSNKPLPDHQGSASPSR